MVWKQIINNLKDYINDIIAFDNLWGTVLDCVIATDTEGYGHLGSERANNATLRELENSIRDIGRKTSEGLWPDISSYNNEIMEMLIHSGADVNITN